MNGSRLNPHARGERSSLDALNRTIEGLEARIEDLLKASSSRDPRGADRHPHADTLLPEPRHPERRRQVEQDTLQEIRERQRMLEAARERRPVADLDDRPQRSLRSDLERAAMPAEPRVFRDSRRASDARPPYADPVERPVARTPSRADASALTVAEALNDLRRELRQDISENIAREMRALREDVQSMQGLTSGQRLSEDVRDELARLADGVDALSQRTPGAATDLRAELEDLRLLIDGMASRDSFERNESRWSQLEERLDEFDTTGIQKELIALAYRIDGVKAELGLMADSPAIRALEDKVLMLATAVEALSARPQDSERIADQFTHIDTRLDEITRAVAFNTSRPRNEAAEHAALRSLEERLIDLNDKIDGLSRMQDAYRLEERLEELAETFARQPQQELTGTLSDLARKIDALAHERHGDGLTQRLEQLTRRIDELANSSAAVAEPGLERLESRLDAIAARLDEASRAPRDDSHSLRNLEAQITHLSGLLNAPRQEAGLSDELDQRMAAIESYMTTSDEYVLEAARQAAESVIEAYSRTGSGTRAGEASADHAALLALAGDLKQLEELTRGSEERVQETFGSLHRTLVQIAERLDTMESRLSERPLFGAGSAARERQETAPLRPPMAAAEMADAPRGLLARAAEQLRSEAATGIEPSLPHADLAEGEKEPMARKGLLASLSRRLRPARRDTTERAGDSRNRTVIDPAPSIDPVASVDSIEDGPETELLEPGSGVPDVRKILERVRASQAAAGFSEPEATAGSSDRMDYIAAARRAARAAVQEIAPEAADKAPRSVMTEAEVPKRGLKAVFQRHRRPILMAVGAVLLALMAMPLATSLTRGERAPQPAPVKTGAAVPQRSAPAVTAEPAKTAQAAPAASVDSTTSAATVAAPVPPVQASALEASVSSASGPAAAPAITVPAGIGPQPLADAAASGNPQALFEIGTRFTEGHGVAADPQEAARWYRMAADRGYPPALYRLGRLYEKGNGVARDLAAAQRLYEAAARAGHAGAMHNLAVLHASGATGSVDYAAAVHWFAEAAEHGVADSQFNLAILYARGNGTAQNLPESYTWFAIAAAGGDSDAAAKRDEVARALKPAELEAARQKAATWQQQPLDPRANGTNMPQDWVEKGNGSASIDMDKAIRNIQAILNRNGFDAGQPDGLMGRKTLAAIKAFQRQNGLPEDGNITEALVRKLLAQTEARGA